jgi:hypothetical protein
MADISIQDAYQQVLGRAPSADEIKYWQSTFGSSVDPVELSTFSVAAQPERAAAPNTNDAVRQMYQQVLGRAPDASGLQYFADRFGTSVDPTELGIFRGMAAEEIAANAAKAAGTGTTGTTTTTGTTGSTAGTDTIYQANNSNLAALQSNAATNAGATGMSITQAYQQVLGRTPSASEIAYWTTQFGADVDAKELSNFSVAAQPERAAAPTTNSSIRQMYLSVLGREPDASGLKYFSDRFGADVDASELGIFRGMSTQEINANAARNAGTTTNTAGTTTGATTGTVQPITRPTTPRQVTGTQLAPAGVTNTAITGTPYTNIYTPSTVQQNAPTLAQINAASQSANPYQSLMALTPQRTLSPAYAGMLGQTTANTNLGGYDSSLYSKPLTGLLAPSTVAGGGGTDLVNNSRGDYGGDNTGGIPGLNIDPVALAAARVAGLFGSAVSLGKPATVTDATFNPTQAGIDYAGASGKSSWGKSGNADQDIGGTTDGGGTGEGLGAAYDKFKGGLITPRNIRGPNPPGPDDGNTNIGIGEYVIRKSAVKKYGSNIFEQINAGKIPAQRLKSLLE